MLPPLPSGPLVAWYGDDFTGAAAVMEVLSLAGFPSVLFLEPPGADDLARFPGMRGIGVAGDARARGRTWMEAHLPEIFTALRGIGAPLLHYKICSTLDSSPETGSIGIAADLGMDANEWAPLVVAAPPIRRWQAFGNLFAAGGGEVHRLDRHPTMAAHPVTPMTEADVRRHLEHQTAKRIGLVDLIALKAGTGEATLRDEVAGGAAIVAFDVVDDETLRKTGAILWREAARRPLFAIGSQGVEYALVAAWLADKTTAPREAMDRMSYSRQPLPPAKTVAVVSGSCSPLTADQVARAEAAGFEAVTLAARLAVSPRDWNAECHRAEALALGILARGRSPIVLTARGPADLAIPALAEARNAAGLSAEAVNDAIGEGLGRILARLVAEGGAERAVIAGGDTSSRAARVLGIRAFTVAAPLAPGASLLNGHRVDSDVTIALKGGQMGSPDFFIEIRDGARVAA